MNLTRIRGFLLIFKVKMSSSSKLLFMPIGVRGMKDLDREKFLRNITVPILKVQNEKLSKVAPICKPFFLKIENFKPVQDLAIESDESLNKCIYLNPEIITEWDSFSEEFRTKLLQYDINEKNFDKKDVQLSYSNFKYETIFKAVLPEKEEIVTGFSQIGHIIHLNLRDHLLDYRSLIGQVLIDKIKNCRTVVNKLNIIDNVYRNFRMEVIAGDEDFLVTVKENKCNFRFDFSQVYWNSRLCKEHDRILQTIKPWDVLFDVFCGVGPFAIPAAKQKCKVFANDLNPESFKWLKYNAKKNKIDKKKFKSYNMDGKDFICIVFKRFITNYCRGREKLDSGAKIHITMNLPLLAVEFLKYFNGLIKEKELIDKCDCEIIVHVYCFSSDDNVVEDAKKKVIQNIGRDISDNIIKVIDVRNVAPKKEMMRVTFNLTKDIIFGHYDSEENDEPPSKKQCERETET